MNRLVTLYDFHASKLNNNRNIFVYLPPSYENNPAERYPVLYMHDGQGLFHPNMYSNQSWEVDKTADRLMLENKMKEIIIVGITNGGSERLNEFAHNISEDHSGLIDGLPEITACKGELYEDFIIHELKPYMDRNFRTLSDSSNTALLGSSAGGLVTYNIAFRHPEIFGMAGLMSPYFIKLDYDTLNEFKVCNLYPRKGPDKIWLDVGEAEANIMVQHVRKFAEHFINLGYRPVEDFAFYCVPDAAHTETDWARRLCSPLLYFFGEPDKVKSVQLYGRTLIGKKGKKVWINPVIEFDNGFTMTDINGTYQAEDPDLLEVLPDGTLTAKCTGRTTVTYTYRNLTASGDYTVIDHLSENVIVAIKVRVPESTPVGSVCQVGKLQLKNAYDNIYSEVFMLPRDFIMQFTIHCITKEGKLLTEANEDDHAAIRRIKADHDIEMDYTVSDWVKGN